MTDDGYTTPPHTDADAPFTWDEIVEAINYEPPIGVAAEMEAQAQQEHARERAERFDKYRIPDRRIAEWALNLYLTVLARQTERERDRDEWIERQRRSFEQDNRQDAATLARFEGFLARWGIEQREITGNATITLPSGDIATTESRDTPTIDNDDVLAAWVEKNMPDIVVHTKSKVMFRDIKPKLRIVNELVVTSDYQQVTDATVVWPKDGEPFAMNADGERLDAIVVVGDFVVDEQGRLVPGMTVNPGGIKVKIRPGL